MTGRGKRAKGASAENIEKPPSKRARKEPNAKPPAKKGSKGRKNTGKLPTVSVTNEPTTEELLAQMKKCSVSMNRIDVEPYLSPPVQRNKAAGNGSAKAVPSTSKGLTKNTKAVASSSRPTRVKRDIPTELPQRGARTTRVGNNSRTPVQTRSRVVQMAKKVSDKYRRHSRTIQPANAKREQHNGAETSTIAISSDEEMVIKTAPAIGQPKVQTPTAGTSYGMLSLVKMGDTRWTAPKIHIKEEVVDLCDDTILDENVKNELKASTSATASNVYNIVINVNGVEEIRSQDIEHCLANVIHGSSQTVGTTAVANSNANVPPVLECFSGLSTLRVSIHSADTASASTSRTFSALSNASAMASVQASQADTNEADENLNNSREVQPSTQTVKRHLYDAPVMQAVDEPKQTNENEIANEPMQPEESISRVDSPAQHAHGTNEEIQTGPESAEIAASADEEEELAQNNASISLGSIDTVCTRVEDEFVKDSFIATDDGDSINRAEGHAAIVNEHLSSDSEDEYDQLVQNKIKSTSFLSSSIGGSPYSIDVATTSVEKVSASVAPENVVEVVCTEEGRAAAETTAIVQEADCSPDGSSLRSDKEIVPAEFVKENVAEAVVCEGDQIDESVGGTVTKASTGTVMEPNTSNASNEPNNIQPTNSKMLTVPPMTPKPSTSSNLGIKAPTNAKTISRNAFVSRSENVNKSMDNVGTPKRTKAIKRLITGNEMDMPSPMKRFLMKPKTKTPLIEVAIVDKSLLMYSLSSNFDVSGDSRHGCSTPIPKSLANALPTGNSGKVALPVASTSSENIYSLPETAAKPEAQATNSKGTSADSGCAQSFSGVSTGPSTSSDHKMSTGVDGTSSGASTSTQSIYSLLKITAKPVATHSKVTSAESDCIHSFTGVSTGPSTNSDQNMSTAVDGTSPVASGSMHSLPEITTKPEANAIRSEESSAVPACIQSFAEVSTSQGTPSNENMSTAVNVAPSDTIDPESISIDRQTERPVEMQINENADQPEVSVDLTESLEPSETSELSENAESDEEKLYSMNQSHPLVAKLFKSLKPLAAASHGFSKYRPTGQASTATNSKKRRFEFSLDEPTGDSEDSTSEIEPKRQRMSSASDSESVSSIEEMPVEQLKRRKQLLASIIPNELIKFRKNNLYKRGVKRYLAHMKNKAGFSSF